MPVSREAPPVEEVDLEQGKLILALQQMRDAHALSLVRKTFFHYETFRQQNHDRRWQTNDALFFGWMPQRVWEGSTIPRASLSMPLVFDQIEAALPGITQALFGSQPDWFQVEASAGGDPTQARSIRDHLLYLLDHDKDEYGLTAQNDLEIAIKSILLYGNGGVAIEWDGAKERPQVSWVDNRDIYFDPGAPGPAVDYCRSVIRRSMKTVEEVIGWKNTKGMMIPETEVLWGMATSRQTAAGDQTKQVQSALMGVRFVPGADDVLPNPTDRLIEVLTYYSKSRIIVVLNREFVAYAEDNPYGFIPFAFAPCYTVPGKFYSMSIPDVQEGNQRYIEALINGRLDEISLALHPPRVHKSSSPMTPSQQRWRPGMVYRAQDPKNDVIPLMPAGATTNVYEEVDYLERLAEKRTGINALGMGVPRPSNANRTASGMQMQLQGSANRLQTIVKHIEDYLLIPMLYKMYKMIQVHMTTEKELAGRSPQGENTTVQSAVFKAPVNFKILASSQMVTRDKLSQLVPIYVQYLAQGPLLDGLKATGMTVDWTEMFTMLQDATGVGKIYKLIRPMNQQEQQAAQQPPPQVMMEQQKAQQEQQTKLQITEMTNQTTLQKEQMSKQVSPMEMQMEQMKFELEAQKEQMKLQIEQQKMELEKQKAQLQMQIKQMEMQMKAQELEMKQAFDAAGMQQDFQLKQQQGMMDQQLAQTQHESMMQQTEEQGVLKSEQAQAQHDQKLKMMKDTEKLSAKGRPVKKRPENR